MPRLYTFILPALLSATLFVSACSKSRPVADDEYNDYRTRGPERGKLGGDQGLVFGIGGKTADSAADQGGGALGVNAYLWRADPFGGVIITDWYSPPGAQGERFKATAYILGRQLRTDGIRINVFRQIEQSGRWVDQPVATSTAGEIEDKVLARARELRSQTSARS